MLRAEGTRDTPEGERLRTIQARSVAALRPVIEQHGGTVETFIGDAVMAVFGTRSFASTLVLPIVLWLADRLLENVLEVEGRRSRQHGGPNVPGGAGGPAHAMASARG